MLNISGINLNHEDSHVVAVIRGSEWGIFDCSLTVGCHVSWTDVTCVCAFRVRLPQMIVKYKMLCGVLNVSGVYLNYEYIYVI
jgi:hypothetical protein